MMKRNLVVLIALLALTALIGGAALAQDELPYTINIGGNERLGAFLVGPTGMTLYVFERDGIGMSNCVDQCAQNWPPLTVESADSVTVEPGIPGEIGTIERADGTLQVTYNDMPLYYWVNDAAPGDATGHNVRWLWSVVAPATIYIGRNADLGGFLVGPTGMTLYLFANDEPGMSNCTGQCAQNWPPLTVESADAIVLGPNLLGEVGTIEREDGSLQVTYNGMPLYYWVNDAARGDATGEGVRDVWFTVAPETVGVATSAELGDYLIGPNGMTLYMFANDEPGVSNCVDQCAQNWPPYTVNANDRLVAAAGINGELSTVERPDGSLQVAYNGMPLYFWINDAAPGDTTGEGVRGVWAVVAP